MTTLISPIQYPNDKAALASLINSAMEQARSGSKSQEANVFVNSNLDRLIQALPDNWIEPKKDVHGLLTPKVIPINDPS
jgi:hypothetical protein